MGIVFQKKSWEKTKLIQEIEILKIKLRIEHFRMEHSLKKDKKKLACNMNNMNSSPE